MYEPDRGRGPGQRFQQRDHPVRGHEVHHHEVDRERGHMGAVPDRAGPGTLRAGGGVTAPAPAAGHLVLVVLGDPHRHLRAALDPTVRRIISAARDIPAHRLVRDRREVDRQRSVAMGALDGVDALVVPTAPMHPRIDEVAADPVGVNSRMGTYTNFCNLFDLCAVAVPSGTAGQAQFGITVLARAFEDAVALDVAALVTGDQAPVDVWPLAVADSVDLVVFGAHLRGGPLVHQLIDLGARWAGEVTTAPHYRMSVLPTVPAKPAITRVPDGAAGTALLGHRWLLSPAALGRFLAALPAPMQLGKVEFDDGTWRTAFGCDGAAATGPDISAYGSWPAAIAAGAV